MPSLPRASLHSEHPRRLTGVPGSATLRDLQAETMAGKYLTDAKVAIFGAAGAIGSNLVQELLATGISSHVSMYDPFEKGLEGAAMEMFHCAFEGATIEYTTNAGDALKGAKYLISSGGAPR